MFRIGTATALLIALCCHTAQAQTARYTFKIFPGAGLSFQSLVMMNRAGAKLFQVTTEKGKSECLLRQGSKQIVISDPKGAYTQCTGLGSNGGVVGFYGASSNPPYQAFAYLNGAYADVLPSLANAVYGNLLNAVSPNGLMAGTYDPAAQQTYTIFVTYGTAYYVVPLPPDDFILQATGINDSAMLVGQAYYITMRGDDTISYLFAGATQSEIAFPGSVVTYAYNINDKGDVVGYYENSDRIAHGFIYSARHNSYFGPIDLPGASATNLTGITDDDIVTGYATPAGSTRIQAIIGTPAAYRRSR
jgi:hypothetical protein